MSMIRLSDYFAELTDPRRREVTYPLINVVVIAVCAVICGADDFVAIDGKTLRRSFDKATGKAAIHMVSAWATANHVSLE